ncbi:hypothetical protein K493DRAFT_306585 [Basidiobolus meristosporus CBS 931.73]|uniref:PWWP domain-containing protein n=1 Tax=Basidiobolus meristosporus CBS 931.73 TaxID=1314790 RepID=A0A1Y1XS24_9FUNG|nr:hypothetical protein K493DRAFT_306585 [Basidiobolus meristosporus CBS 931.73]|eukprot:ORX88475.1 hypothetical protein K493DRAFT_306585 [Basidiobolus meristosporus CBS 931.73]
MYPGVSHRVGEVTYNPDATTKSAVEQRNNEQQAMRDKYGVLFDLLEDRNTFDNTHSGNILDFAKPSHLNNSAALSAISHLLRQVKSADLKASQDKVDQFDRSISNRHPSSVSNLPLSQVISIIKSCTIICAVCKCIWVDDALFSEDPAVVCMRELKGIQAKDLLLGLMEANARSFCHAKSQGKVLKTRQIIKKGRYRMSHSYKSKRRRLPKGTLRRSKDLAKHGNSDKVIHNMDGSSSPSASIHIGPLSSKVASATIINTEGTTAQIAQLTQEKRSYDDSSSELSEAPTSELNSVSDMSESHSLIDCNSEDLAWIYGRTANDTSTFDLRTDVALGSDSQNTKQDDVNTIDPRASFGIPVSEFRRTTAIFVNPLDENEPFWWPALLVPTSETDKSMRKPKSGQYIVRYFEDGTYSLCWPYEFVIFDSTSSPFTQFKKLIPNFLHHIAVRRALAYLETEQVPNEIRWARWKNNSRRVLIFNFQYHSSSQLNLRKDEDPDIAIIETYLYMIGDEIQVNAPEDPKKSFKALVKDVDVLNDVHHKGLHYNVQYLRADVR